MLMNTRPELEPLARLRAALPDNCLSTFELLTGTVQMPPDQPQCANAVATLASSFVLYAKGIPHARPEFNALVEHARTIADVVTAHAIDIQGLTPAGQLSGRVSRYPAWALLTQLSDEQIPLRIAFGSEVAIAILDRGQLNSRFCEQLRRDAGKYGRPQHGEDRLAEDLADLSFGHHWLAHFEKVDRQIRRRVELPDPNGPIRPEHADPKNRLDLLARLKWRFEYPDPKHRQAGLDDSHLPREQFRRATLAVRNRVELGDAAAIIQSICLITRLTPDLVFSLPLITNDKPVQLLGLDIERGVLALDLRVLFPNRKLPSPATALLFHISHDLLAIPLPQFLARELRDRLHRNPSANLLGDLVDWVSVNFRTSLVVGEQCKLASSLARASKSTGALAIMAGVDRLAAACITWDFSLIGSARMYYARLTGEDIHTGCSLLYATMDWGDPALAASELNAIGSRCVLTTAGVQKVFCDLVEQCNALWPGRRAKCATLLKHHERYTQYVVALVSFCLGLREVHVYRLLASELLHGQTQITLHDKQGGDRLMAQPVSINSLIREQIRQYLCHCHALHKRLERLRDQEGRAMIEALEKIISGEGPLLVLLSPRGIVRPAGNYNTWAKLPEHIRVPGNVGRHYWQNVLRQNGLKSSDIDRFMRHRVVGLENNTTSQVTSPSQALKRIAAIQVNVLNALGIGAISGLRRA